MTLRGRGRLIGALLAVAALSATPIGARAAGIETIAKYAIMMDVETGTVLLDRDADRPMPPASMSKLMTAYMIFERLRDGRLTLDTKFPVSEKAWRKGGAKMFVALDSMISVEDLLRGIIVQSGNDACIVIAEGIAGSEDAFAEEMTQRGRELGLKNSSFRNATGWPEEGHLMSARDIALLSHRLIADFPEYYPMFAEKSFRYGGIKQYNRNPLLRRGIGADGLKTGYTKASGYGLAASAIQKDRRVILVIAGLQSARLRAREALRLMNLAFGRFRNYQLFAKGDVIDSAGVWLGRDGTVPLIADRDVKVTLQPGARDKLKAVVSYLGPVPAPVVRGQPIARLRVTAPGLPIRETPLLAGEAVAKRGLLGRIGPALAYFLMGDTVLER